MRQGAVKFFICGVLTSMFALFGCAGTSNKVREFNGYNQWEQWSDNHFQLRKSESVTLGDVYFVDGMMLMKYRKALIPRDTNKILPWIDANYYTLADWGYDPTTGVIVVQDGVKLYKNINTVPKIAPKTEALVVVNEALEDGLNAIVANGAMIDEFRSTKDPELANKIEETIHLDKIIDILGHRQFLNGAEVTDYLISSKEDKGHATVQKLNTIYGILANLSQPGTSCIGEYKNGNPKCTYFLPFFYWGSDKQISNEEYSQLIEEARSSTNKYQVFRYKIGDHDMEFPAARTILQFYRTDEGKALISAFLTQ